ncbi:hypothetical protein VUR80DRAFT_3960 [Thermomyces stellatus]
MGKRPNAPQQGALARNRGDRPPKPVAMVRGVYHETGPTCPDFEGAITRVSDHVSWVLRETLTQASRNPVALSVDVCLFSLGRPQTLLEDRASRRAVTRHAEPIYSRILQRPLSSSGRAPASSPNPNQPKPFSPSRSRCSGPAVRSTLHQCSCKLEDNTTRPPWDEQSYEGRQERLSTSPW